VKVILTHENADFDSLAAQLAAAKLYAEAIPVLSRRVNRELQDFLAMYGDQLPFRTAAQLPRRRVREAIIVDAQSVPAVRGMDSGTAITIIDHHPLHGEAKPGTTYKIEEAGATTSLLVEQLRELRVSLTPVEATLMLLGIYEDTGSLSYSGTTARDLRSAAWLLEQGANLAVARDILRHPLDERYQPVYSQLVENVEWHNRHGQAILIATAYLDEYLDELSTLAHKLDDVFEPDASFLLFVFKDQIQFIARSSTPAVDVGEVARVFGGGGHGAAAAALIQNADAVGVRKKLVEVLRQNVKPPVTVRQIMSHSVHTLGPEMSLSQAEGYVRRYGHEGFPVVERGQLVGVITRREIDRAMQHRLGDSTVRSYMHTGDMSVSPSDSVTAVQQIMTAHDVGQVPVVEDGRVLGIVTRTDLIKLWGAHAQPERREQVQEQLRQALPMTLLSMLWQARDAANRMGYSLYVVGGFVRDLLLGKPTLDLDLVVEGDAIALARELAKQLKGRVRSHARFGTAKVILGGTAGTNLPSSLDFVTARTEFYQHPTALPEVERSSIKQDLYRRDFTINTMAICLDGDRYGELLDFYGGERDLRDGLVRALHNFSFVEDPTRILRAVRLEQRLGFKLESRTAELIDDALGLLGRVTGERLRHELELILEERAPAMAIRRLAELGVLRRLEPGLDFDEWLGEKMEQAMQWSVLHPAVGLAGSLLHPAIGLAAESQPVGEDEQTDGPPAISQVGVDQKYLLLAILTYRLTRMQLDRFLGRLRFSLEVGKYLREVHGLHALAWRLDRPNLRPSRIYQLLHGYSPRAILAFSVALDSSAARDHVMLYLDRLRWVRPTIRGEFLKSQGVEPGPVYRQILDRLLYARLDGKIRTASEEEAMAKALVARLTS
jgi:tRNA nucleotidyltransferase (CCA-adding enzyme)